MKLIGGLRLGASAPGDYSFYGNLFSRLPKEASHTGEMTRYVVFDYLTEAKDSITFLGIEVDRIENIPKGIMAWGIEDDEITVLEERNGKDVEIWKTELDWEWSEVSPSPCNRGLTGEFSFMIPPEWSGNNSSVERQFSMTANCYIMPNNPGCDDSVKLEDHNPNWAEKYREMAKWLRDKLDDDVALRIEHFGSTAIPGIPAKPVIDILVQVPSNTIGKQKALPLFNNELWELWGDKNMTFVKRNRFAGTRTHHIHMMAEESEIQEKLAFRDYLRSHPEDALRYADLKKQLAESHSKNREKYTDAKADFVNEIVKKAMG